MRIRPLNLVTCTSLYDLRLFVGGGYLVYPSPISGAGGYLTPICHFFMSPPDIGYNRLQTWCFQYVRLFCPEVSVLTSAKVALYQRRVLCKELMYLLDRGIVGISCVVGE